MNWYGTVRVVPVGWWRGISAQLLPCGELKPARPRSGGQTRISFRFSFKNRFIFEGY